jgi:hypothetical protein
MADLNLQSEMPSTQTPMVSPTPSRPHALPSRPHANAPPQRKLPRPDRRRYSHHGPCLFSSHCSLSPSSPATSCRHARSRPSTRPFCPSLQVCCSAMPPSRPLLTLSRYGRRPRLALDRSRFRPRRRQLRLPDVLQPIASSDYPVRWL